MKRRSFSILALLLALCITLSSCSFVLDPGQIPGNIPDKPGTEEPGNTPATPGPVIDLSNIPDYTGSTYIELYNNIPHVTDAQKTGTQSYETYSPLDSLGRCGVVEACIGRDLMPKEGEDRGNISSIKPTGWVQAEYDCIGGRILWNRAHLIGWQLTAENANRSNLITGTRYMNEAMIPFESMVADYIKETDNHVYYRVTPIFHGNELVARGVQMEAWSVEDEGDGICFNVYLYNVQPNIVIDYATGESRLSDNVPNPDDTAGQKRQYILNKNPLSMKIHLPTCSSVQQMNPANREEFFGTLEELEAMGYSPCGSCKPQYAA